MKARATRHSVLIRARMRAGGRPVDVCVRNISARGMMLQCADPPPRGTYVEVAIGKTSIVGRVAWTNNRRAGVQARELIDVATYLGGAVTKPSPSLLASQRVRARDMAVTAEDSRAIAHNMQFVFMLFCIAAFALFLVSTAHGFLSGLFALVTKALHVEVV